VALTLSLGQILDRVRKRGDELPADVAGHLLREMVRVAGTARQAASPWMFRVDDDANLHLVPPGHELFAAPPVYVAPEVANYGVSSDDPRALVYAAGVLGYEIVTGRPLQGPPAAPGPELRGPFRDVIRVALSEREKRYGDLSKFSRAIEKASVQAPGSGAAGVREELRKLHASEAELELETLEPLPNGSSGAVTDLQAQLASTKQRADRLRTLLDQQQEAGALKASRVRELESTLAAMSERKQVISELARVTALATPAPALPKPRKSWLAHFAFAFAGLAVGILGTVVWTLYSNRMTTAGRLKSPPILARTAKAETNLALREPANGPAQEDDGADAEGASPAFEARRLGAVYMSQGKREEARREYQRYLKLNPTAEDAESVRKLIDSLSPQRR
jgi:hypothetical protein